MTRSKRRSWMTGALATSPAVRERMNLSGCASRSGRRLRSMWKS